MVDKAKRKSIGMANFEYGKGRGMGVRKGKPQV